MLSACSADIKKIRKELQGCIAGKEQEFLALGAQLHDISGSSMQLADESQELITATADTILDTATNQLDEKLQAMREICSSSDNSDIELLSSIQNTLHVLLELISSYSRIVKTLQMLGISTRIESARLGSDGKGFSTLADDVEKLALKIVEYSANISGYAEQLQGSTVEAQNRLQAMHQMQTLCESTLFASITHNLGQLREQGAMSRQASAEITALMGDINTRVGSIVSAMQFHDIVRQQVEHVEESLGEVMEYCSAHTGGQDDDILLFSLAEVGTLQVHQLENARTSFYSAVETLRDDLRATGELVLQVAASASLSQKQDGVSSGETVLGTVSKGITEISQHISMLAEQGENIGEVISAVVATVSEMSEFLEDIEEVGAEIGLIAMNASIRAAHTGEKGRALGVLAGAIQHLSRDAGEQTDAISKALFDVGEMAEKLKALATGYFNSERAGSMIDELTSLLAQLEEVSGRAGNLVSHIQRSSEALAATIDENVSAISVHVEVCDMLQVAEQELQQASENARSAVVSEKRLTLPAEVRTLLSRYTMEKERHVHRAVLGQDSAGDASGVDLFESEDASLEAITEAFEDEFGDNIELF